MDLGQELKERERRLREFIERSIPPLEEELRHVERRRQALLQTLTGFRELQSLLNLDEGEPLPPPNVTHSGRQQVLLVAGGILEEFTRGQLVAEFKRRGWIVDGISWLSPKRLDGALSKFVRDGKLTRVGPARYRWTR